MKTAMFIPALLLTVGMLSCQKDSLPSNDNEMKASMSKSTVSTTRFATKGCDVLYVNNFMLNGEDKTSEFSAYNFSFCSDNTVTARSQFSEIPGTWTVNDAAGTLIFNFKNPGNFTTVVEAWLNGQWHIITFDDQTLEMDRQTADGNMYVKFTKG